MMRLAMMPIGMSRWGFLVSSAVVETASNPMKAKKTTAKPDEITRPTHSHRHITDGVFENKIPTDDPGDYFAQRRVRISISRSRHRNHGGELGVTKGGEAAGNGSHHERKHHCRTCARPAEHQRCVRCPRLNEIQNGRFPNRRL